jgi:hypothetical protein
MDEGIDSWRMSVKRKMNDLFFSVRAFQFDLWDEVRGRVEERIWMT